MEKRQTIGVQSLSGDVFHIRVVQIVSDQRKTDVFHMNPDLMGASGSQPE